MEILIQLCVLSLCQLAHTKPLMLLVLDGFRWDYVDMCSENLVGFPRLMRQGVRAQYMVMDFPTLSLPNQYTMMTGLYNEYHGIVSDDMYDPEMDLEFRYRLPSKLNPESSWWREAEPIWIAAEKQNKAAYIYHWPYCNVELGGVKATYCSPYENVAKMTEIAQAAKTGVFLLANSSANLVGIFVRVTDLRAHFYGPESENVRRVVQSIDRQIDRVLNLLAEADNKDVTLMVVSTHGMTAVSSDKLIYINDIIEPADVDRFVGDSAYLGIWPKAGVKSAGPLRKFSWLMYVVFKMATSCLSPEQYSPEFSKRALCIPELKEECLEVYNLLRAGNLNLFVYKKEDTPKSWHFRQHPRIPPIVVTPVKGWTILPPGKRYRYYGKNKDIPERGNHGYDNNIPDMRGSFFISGPDFKSDFVSEPIDVVDVYQLICKVLDIKLSPHNGTWENVSAMFTASGSSKIMTGIFTYCMVFSLVTFALINVLEKPRI